MKRIILLSLPILASMQVMAADNVVSDTSRVVDLDEVVVVSQSKEAYRLRQQPLSSSVFGESDMQQLHVRDLRQLSAYVPSFVMPQYGSRLTSSMYMRGTGARINAAAPSVPVYYDNIPLMSKSAFNSHFYMLDRVDVLRGPQSTLYGMNSEGGLVRIFSKNPMNYQGTDVNMTVGAWRNGELAHFHRPSENFAFSVAGFFNAHDGFYKNQNLDKNSDRLREYGSRVRLMWKPTERLTADLTADYQFTQENAFPYGQYDVAAGEVADPSTSFLNTYRRNMLNTGLHLSYDAGSVLLTSSTSYQHLYDRMTMDQDYTPANRMMLKQHQKMNAVTEELTVKGTDNGSWKWVFGAFGSYQGMQTDAPVTFGSDMNQMLAQMILNYMPSAAQNMFSTWEITQFDVPETFKTPQTNLALFHESNLHVTDRLTATVGLRLDYNKAKVDYDSRGYLDLHYIAAMGPRTIEQTSQLTDTICSSTSKSSTQLLPKFGLTYRIDNRGSNVYAQVSKGYRAGGYNIQMFSDIMQTEMQANGLQLRQGNYNINERLHTPQTYEEVNKTIAYNPETSWNYEVGTHLNLFDGKLQADLSTYYMQVRNLQLSKMAGNYSFGRQMVNAGKSASCGLEAALRGQAFDDHLSWAVSYSFTHATFREYTDSVDVTTTTATGPVKTRQEVDYKGNHVPYVPQHMFSAQAGYRIDLSKTALLRSVTVGCNVAGCGRTYWDEANTASQKLYATLGANVSFDCDFVTVSIWSTNITDSRAAVFGMPYNNGFIGQRIMPRMAGMDLRFHF